MLREEGVVRIYDIFFDYDVLLSTDAFFRQIIQGAGVPARDVERGIPRALRQVRARAREGARHRPASRCSRRRTRRGVPIYTSSPGDSSIGMNVAALALEGNKCMIDPNRGRERDGVDRARAPSAAAARARVMISAAAARRTSCCRPSRRSRKCSASTRRGTTTSCRSPTRVPTPAASPARRRPRR